MAISKRVIILEQTGTAPLAYRYVLWADVPAARVAFYAAKQAGMVSAWKDASGPDNSALQSGTVTERSDSTQMQVGATLAQAQAQLQATWTAFQNEITNSNPWLRYGSFMDASNNWTAGGVS